MSNTSPETDIANVSVLKGDVIEEVESPTDKHSDKIVVAAEETKLSSKFLSLPGHCGELVTPGATPHVLQSFDSKMANVPKNDVGQEQQNSETSGEIFPAPVSYKKNYHDV